jgi:hypothetical protein
MGKKPALGWPIGPPLGAVEVGTQQIAQLCKQVAELSLLILVEPAQASFHRGDVRVPGLIAHSATALGKEQPLRTPIFGVGGALH